MGHVGGAFKVAGNSISFVWMSIWRVVSFLIMCVTHLFNWITKGLQYVGAVLIPSVVFLGAVHDRFVETALENISEFTKIKIVVSIMYQQGTLKKTILLSILVGLGMYGMVWLFRCLIFKKIDKHVTKWHTNCVLSTRRYKENISDGALHARYGNLTRDEANIKEFKSSSNYYTLANLFDGTIQNPDNPKEYIHPVTTFEELQGINVNL